MNILLSTLKTNHPQLKIKTDPKTLKTYSKDKSNLPGQKPGCVIFPKTIKEIESLLKLAQEHHIPITPRGAGTCKSGGAIPSRNGVSLVMTEFNQILEIDPINQTATVQPGVILEDLQKAVEAQGLFYPPDPASLKQCTIGGTVAENAGGPRAKRYGVTGDYVQGLKGVFASGEPFSLGGKCKKNVAGYDVMRLLIGSEGTLAIITEITLKLIPLPGKTTDYWIPFTDTALMFHFLHQLNKHNITPITLEFMDEKSLKPQQDKVPLPLEKYQLYLSVDTDQKPISDLLNHMKIGSWLQTRDKKKKQRFRKIREAISESLTKSYPYKRSHDITVPISAMPKMLEVIDQCNKPPITVLSYGHLGDGNIHVNITANKWVDHVEQIEGDLFEEALKLGGTITGEHGVGLSKKKYMEKQFSQSELNIFKQIKSVFDPNHVLNPDKIL